MDFISDHSWMSRRKGPGVIGATIEFRNGCDKFLDYAYSHTECVNSRKYIRCPCLKCKNTCYRSRDEIKYHLFISGFMPNYEECWWAHGQKRTSVVNQVQNMEPGMSRMNDMVRDLAGPHFNWEQDRDQPMNSDATTFFKLLEEGSEPLWPGCTRQTTLSAVAMLLNIKVDHNISQECFESLLKAIKSMLPDGETLPENLYFCKKMMKKLGLGYQKIDACPNDCMLYYKEDERKTKCVVCGHDRFKPNSGGQHTKRIAIPYKVLRYFPITDRLRRLYLSSRTAKHMTWHARSPAKDGELCHPADGKAWKHFNISHPEFASEPRNVRLGLSSDGFNPFGHSAIPYSCWPVIVTPYNFPPWMCMKQPYMFLSLIIPGPKSPGQDIDVYLRPLIDELKALWDVGVQTWDVSTQTNFNLKAAIMWTINDFPAYGMLSGWSTHGKMSCPYCMEHTKAFNLKHGRKPCFFDCHRRFLPEKHPFRKNKINFTKGKVEDDTPVKRLSGEQVRARVMRLPIVPFGKKFDSEKIPGYGDSHNWKRRSIFWELPYWSTNLIRHNLDVMHIEKNVFDNVFNTVMDVKGRTKDNEKARMDMKEICKRPDLNLHQLTTGKVIKPHAKFTLTRKQIDDICGWIKTLKLPDGYVSNIARCVGNRKLQGMKSHDCHVFMERLLPIAFRDLLDRPTWDALTELSYFFKDLCSKVLHEKDLEILEKNIIEVTCKLEKIFPPGFFDSMEHLPIHLVYEASVGGPVHYRWMYPFERLMGNLKKKVKNRARVEGSIGEAYSFEEISTFISDYFPDEVLTKANRVSRHDDGGNVELNDRVSIFGLPGRAYGKGKRIFLSDKALHAAHTYILLNCEEMEDFVCAFDIELKEKQQGITNKDLHIARDQQFTEWIKNKALNDSAIPPQIRPLAMGPDRDQVSRNGYKVNGFDFHKKAYAKGKKTTNSGVWVKSECYDEIDCDFYGELDDIVELSYRGTYGGHIVMFKCDWFDSDKGIRVDCHGIVDIDVERRTFMDQPFVLPTQATQVYYTPSATKKRERPPANWQVVIHTPARTRFEVADGEAYQEEALHNPLPVHVDDDLSQVYQLHGVENDNGDVETIQTNYNEDNENEYDEENVNEFEEELLSNSESIVSDEEVDEDGYSSSSSVEPNSNTDNESN